MGRKELLMNDTYFNTCLYESANDLFRVAYGIVGDEDLANEVVSETVYRAYKNKKKIKEPQYLKTWLVRVTINISRDILKRNKRFIAYDDSYMINPVEENFDFVHDYIDKLPTDLKELVVLKYIMEYTYRDISLIKEEPESTIKSKVKKALKLLRIEMEDLVDE
jgi:RNA polymerase sigma-70 factor, ECF subfamily